MSAGDEIQLQQEIRRFVAERDQLNDRLRSYRGGRGGGGFSGRGGGFGGRGGGFGSRGGGRAGIGGATYVRTSVVNGVFSKSNISGGNTLKGDAVAAPEAPSKRLREEPHFSASFEGPEFEIEKRPKVVVDEEMVDRNRRIMNVGVFGQLLRARDQLQKEENSRQAQLHKTQEQRVEEKLLNGKRNLVELKRRDMEEKRNEDTRRLQLVQRQLAAKENELLQMNLVKHFQNMKNFIGTKVYPTIFWIPRIMDEKTEQLQKETVSIIEEKIEGILNSDFLNIPAAAQMERDVLGGEEARATTDSSTVKFAGTVELTDAAVTSDATEKPGAFVDAQQIELQDTDEGIKNEQFVDKYNYSNNMEQPMIVSAEEDTTLESVVTAASFMGSATAALELPIENDGADRGSKIVDATEITIESDKPEQDTSKSVVHLAVEEMVEEQEELIKESLSPLEEAEAVVDDTEETTNASETFPKELIEDVKEKIHRKPRSSSRLQSVKILKTSHKSDVKSPKIRNLSPSAKLTREEIDEMTVTSLTSILKELGLGTQGKKSVLKERLLSHFNL